MIVCPSCARRVPANVATCRCGHAFEPGASSGFVVEMQEPEKGSYPLLGLVGLGAFALGVLLWMNNSRAEWPRPEPAAVGAHAAAAPGGPMVETGAARQAQPTPAAASTSTPENADPADPVAAALARPRAAAAATAPTATDPPATALTTTPSLEDVISRSMPAVVRVETGGSIGSG